MYEYEQHPLFDPPNDEGASIWRYMSLATFVSLLDKRELFFRRLDQFEDKFEGTLPQTTFQAMDQWLREGYNQWRTRACVSCWSLSDAESNALWRIYVPGNEGVAVRSSFAKLRGCFINTSRDGVSQKEAGILIGRVRYGDFSVLSFIDESNSAPNGLIPIIYKQSWYQYEHELRAVLAPNTNSLLNQCIQASRGWSVPLDVDRLIDRIVVAPGSSPWFVDLVRSVVQRYGLSPDLVTQSAMDTPPSL